MLTLSTLVECLETIPASSIITHPDCDITGGIYFLELNTPLESGCIYISSPEEAAALFSTTQSPSFPVTIFSTGPVNDTALLWESNLNLICINLSRESLHNRIAHIYMHFLKLHRAFADAMHISASYKTMAELASSRLGEVPVFIMDSGYKLIAASTSDFSQKTYSRFSTQIMSRLFSDGYLNIDDVLTINQLPNSIGGSRICFKKIRSNGAPTHYFLAIFPENATITPLLKYTAGEIHWELSQYFQTVLTTHVLNPELHDFIKALIERRVRSAQEARTRLEVLQLPIVPYLITLVIKFENTPPMPLSYIALKAKEALPGSIATTYEKQLLLFAPANKTGEFPNLDKDALEVLLESCNAYMGISFPVRSLLSLPTMYQDALNAIIWGRARQPFSTSRIFWIEHYCMDRAFELCSSTLHNEYHNGNVGYICHPALISLIRYDRAHNTDYVDILYQYLLHPSVSECSRKLFIHRNTLINKLNKIEEIIGRKLDDRYFLYNLFFSYQAYTFSRDVLKKDMMFLDK